MTQANAELMDELTDDVSLNTVFEKHPKELTDGEFDRYIAFLRRERAAWKTKQKGKGKEE